MITKTTALNVGATELMVLPLPVFKVGLTKIVFTGSNAGNVTVTARLYGGDKLEAVTDGTIALATKKYVVIPDIPLEAINIAYDGVAELNATVFQIGG